MGFKADLSSSRRQGLQHVLHCASASPWSLSEGQVSRTAGRIVLQVSQRTRMAVRGAIRQQEEAIVAFSATAQLLRSMKPCLQESRTFLRTGAPALPVMLGSVAQRSHILQTDDGDLSPGAQILPRGSEGHVSHHRAPPSLPTVQDEQFHTFFLVC